MTQHMKSSRRTMLKTGLAGAAAAAIPSVRRAEAADDRPVVFAFMGQHCHNPIFMEQNLRYTLAKMGWRVRFTQYAEFVTPEEIGNCDVFIALRGSTDYERVAVGFVPEGVVEERPPDGEWMTEQQETAIIEGMKNRGMGYLALHNSLWNPRPRLKEIFGYEWAMHSPIQQILYNDFNPNHPISRGFNYWIEDDEQFFAKVTNPNHTVLFSSEGIHDKRQTTAGWCFDYGKGRAVAMHPGHTEFVWRNPVFQQLILRSCLWLMRKPIPENTAELVDSRWPMGKEIGGFYEEV